MPEAWFERLMMPPTLPTLLRGAISDGTDQPTGAADERPPIEMLKRAVDPVSSFPLLEKRDCMRDVLYLCRDGGSHLLNSVIVSLISRRRPFSATMRARL